MVGDPGEPGLGMPAAWFISEIRIRGAPPHAGSGTVLWL